MKVLPRFYLTLGISILMILGILDYYVLKHSNISILSTTKSVITEPVSIPKDIGSLAPACPPPVPPAAPVVPVVHSTHPKWNCTYVKAHAEAYKEYISTYTAPQIAMLKYCLGLK